jgi:ATP-dependent Clp protease ATP-binding subunit ClpA
MFERYTEGARRAVFFARYEAIQIGSGYIETEHILLGLLREDKALFRRLLPEVEYESIHKEVVTHTRLEDGKKLTRPPSCPSAMNPRGSSHLARRRRNGLLTGT